MGKNKTTENRGRNPEKTLEMDWTYTKEAKDKHNPSSHTLESTREKEERKTQEHMEKGRRGRQKQDGTQLERGGDYGSGQGWVESSCLWPILRRWVKRLMMMMMMKVVIDAI